MKKKLSLLIPLLSGFLNGFFGTGGGVALWFAASRKNDAKTAFATSSVGVLILSVASAFFYRDAPTPFTSITPLFLFYSVIGGAIGAALLGRIPARGLRILFALLLIGSGVYAIVKGALHAIAS